MPDREQELRDLEAAKSRIAQGERLVAEQEQRLEVLRKDGHPTEKAEQVLANLRHAVQALRASQAVIERTLQNMEAGKLP